MSEPLKKFQVLLRELFQFDSADLDFGLYRIMNHKRSVVERFIERDLPQAVRQALEKGALKDQSEQKAALEELAGRIRKDFSDDAISPDGVLAPQHARTNLGKDYLKLQAALGSTPVSETTEAEIYNRLYDFFSRYYDDGDFIALRRYGSRSHYAIPYNGEEVVLHWANKDQYYIKTGEQFRDYRFRAGDGKEAWSVEFKLVSAETETDNKKASSKRFFLFDVANLELDERGRNLVVPVAYRALGADEEIALGNRQQQDKINVQAEEKILRSRRVQAHAPLVAALEHNISEDSAKPRSLLARHLTRFTRRNTSDYFIHKDLGAFLTRELDFYLKAEALDLDTLLRGGAKPAEAWLEKLACLRDIGERIITFLARLENFEKKLFEKRKFITECHWCLTLDHVERAGLTQELASILNSTPGGKRQLTEWKQLFAIDQIKGWKDKVSADTLQASKHLVLDSSYLPSDFESRLLASIEALDDGSDGVLVNADNFHCLAALSERYREAVECIYIDPPYNTGDSEIPYKNSYLKSCWLALMENRLSVAMHLLSEDPALFVAIDDFEMSDLVKLVDSRFRTLRREMIVVNHHPQGGKAKTLAHTHEYMLACVKTTSSRTFLGRAAAEGIELRPFKRSGTAESNFRYGRPNSFYAVLVEPKTKKVVGLEPPPKGDNYQKSPTKDGLLRIYPLGAGNEERVWRRSYESGLELVKQKKLQCTENSTIYHAIDVGDRKAALFTNWVDPRYNAGTYGANLLRDILGKPNLFAYPKSVFTVEDAIFAADLESDALVLDFFGGSGTTGHAVINLNREDHGHRKYLLVEMGDHFDGVLMPRIKKVIYSKDWKDGKPVSREGSSHIFKYFRMESYEDALNGIRFTHEKEGQSALKFMEDEYRLGYWLDFETQGSDTLLNVEKLAAPFEYTLEVFANGEKQVKRVDLPETFNYLIGLIVDRRRPLELNGRQYLLYTGTLRAGGAKTAVLWRDIRGWKPEDFDKERKALAKEGVLSGFATIYVNGDSAIENAQSLDPVFKARMFAPLT